MPANWPDVSKQLATDSDRRVRSRSLSLALKFGDPAARAALRQTLSDTGGPLAPRREALEALLQVKDPSLRVGPTRT